MSNIPKDLKAGQFWHVLYEGRFAIIEIAANGTGFWAHGQDACWDFTAVSEWYNEIPITQYLTK